MYLPMWWFLSFFPGVQNKSSSYEDWGSLVFRLCSYKKTHLCFLKFISTIEKVKPEFLKERGLKMINLFTECLLSTYHVQAYSVAGPSNLSLAFMMNVCLALGTTGQFVETHNNIMQNYTNGQWGRRWIGDLIQPGRSRKSNLRKYWNNSWWKFIFNNTSK